ncbi:MAG: hypothetical protein A2Y80_08710 [Deltaproteobacteria bacterium RBG_13_58_19]|nr:MAG: hypothetical protein A2Y80_08710 [Deltaproteobacteria bacterium RBG_13_58_19]
MIFPPLIFLLMLLFFFLALILLPFLLVGMIGEAFIRLGLSPHMIFWLLILTLLGSLVNIPIYTMEGREVWEEQEISYFGMRVRLPRAPTREKTVLAVNVGGALIPTLLSLYLLSKMPFTLGLPIMLALVIVVIYRLAQPVKGLGIAVPGLVPPILAAVGAFFLCPPELRAPSAYIASTMGTLIGADLLKLREITRLGAPVASIGGAGTFDAIFFSGVIAVLLS